MSKYTTEIRYICENAAGYDESKGYADVDEIIQKAIPSIFSFNVELFDEQYKNVLFSKILRHYYTREIGLETVGLWKLKLQTKLTEILPFYNQLYKSELLKFNPLYDTDLSTTQAGQKNGETNRNSEQSSIGQGSTQHTEEGNKHGTGTETDSSVTDGNTNTNSVAQSVGVNDRNSRINRDSSEVNNKDSTNYNLFSETPQGALTGVDEEEYLTDARKITEKTNQTNAKNDNETANDKTSSTTTGTEDNKGNYKENKESTLVRNDTEKNEVTGSSQSVNTGNVVSNGKDVFNSTEGYIIHVIGKRGDSSYSKLLQEFRKTFLNIDMMIIDELSELFMKLW